MRYIITHYKCGTLQSAPYMFWATAGPSCVMRSKLTDYKYESIDCPNYPTIIISKSLT